MTYEDFIKIQNDMVRDDFIELKNGMFIRLDQVVEFNVHCIDGARRVQCRTRSMDKLHDVQGNDADAFLAYINDRARRPRRKFYPPNMRPNQSYPGCQCPSCRKVRMEEMRWSVNA